MKADVDQNYLSDAEIIRLGKEIMKGSIDPVHGYSHAESVEQNALAVFHELLEKSPAQVAGIDEDLVKIAAWWHDCYKAQFNDSFLYSTFNEGKRSAEIFRQMFSDKMAMDRLEKVANAIRYHNEVWKFNFRVKKINPLLRIILEADGVETVLHTRTKWLLRLCFIVFYLLYPLSRYSKLALHKNIKA